MEKAKVSLMVECAPDAAHLPQVVALVELLLNRRDIIEFDLQEMG